MNGLSFAFEPNAWDRYRMTRQMGDEICAADLLTMLEGENDEALEAALQDMEEGAMSLSVKNLPKQQGSGDMALRLRREAQLVKQGLHPDLLEEGDPLRVYLEEVAGMPACGDEALLASETASGREDAMVMLTNLGLSRVVELAGEYVGYGVLLLDLIQEGSLGLWQGICCYHGGDYALHRDRWIRFSMAKAVTLQARQSGVGQKLRTALEDYRMVDERLLADLGRNPTLEEIAEELHMSVEETAAVKKMLDNARMMSRNTQPEETEETPEEEDQAVENTALFQMRQRILDLLSALSEEDAKLLTLRFGLEGGRPMSPEETGRKLGLTAGEVVAREAAALAKLRNR